MRIDATLICLEAVVCGELQQLAVLDTTPASLLSGTYVVADKFTHQPARKLLIEEHAHGR